MRAFAERLGGDELAGHALAGCELGAADPERDGGVALQRRAADLFESPAVLVGPSSFSSDLLPDPTNLKDEPLVPRACAPALRLENADASFEDDAEVVIECLEHRARLRIRTALA